MRLIKRLRKKPGWLVKLKIGDFEGFMKMDVDMSYENIT